MTTELLVVFTNPVEGKDDEYNDWYDNQHLGDVLNVPGVRSAQRFGLGPVQRMPAPHPWKYMAIYEVETQRIDEVVATLNRLPGSADMPMTDALAKERVNWFFVPRGPARAS
ncbi:MAG: hypothetical protein WBA44_08375 [Mesorhizobium sp.]